MQARKEHVKRDKSIHSYVFVRFMRFVPSASLTSNVANSHDNAGKLQVQEMTYRWTDRHSRGCLYYLTAV
jgi:hypothetical protein